MVHIDLGEQRPKTEERIVSCLCKRKEELPEPSGSGERLTWDRRLADVHNDVHNEDMSCGASNSEGVKADVHNDDMACASSKDSQGVKKYQFPCGKNMGIC
jgi:hypothetical protein